MTFLVLEQCVADLFLHGQIQQALDMACAGLGIEPGNAELCNLAGSCAFKLGDTDQAEHHFRSAIAIFPENSLPYSNLGLLLENQHRLNEAEQCHRRAVLLDTESISCRFNLANFLAVSSSSEDAEEAKAIFLEVLKAEPEHFGARNNMGRLLFETGYTSAAQTAFTAAVTYHPHEATAHVNLASVLLDKGDLSGAEKHFNFALSIDPELAQAHQSLACVFQRRGDNEKSSYHRNMGFGKQPLSTLAYRGKGNPVELLVLGSALEGNLPWRFLIDCNVFQTTLLAVEYFDSRLPLPPHHLILNAIGDADICQSGLEIATRLIERTKVSVINCPKAVMNTGRFTNAKQLGLLPGVITPNMAVIPKADFYSGHALETLASKHFAFPLLLRPPGFHRGNYFEYIDNPGALSTAIEKLPGEELLAIEFLDSRLEDNLFRKYRVMFINGSLYPIHMAISPQWMVHYFSSDMGNNEEYCNEEGRFLNDFSTYLGAEAMSALVKISQVLGLDYCGIDFGMDKNKNVLLYEANATMLINQLSNEKRWDYRRAAIENALLASKRMLVERVTNVN